MRKFKKWLIAALCASYAVSAGAAIADLNEEVTASAAVATEYTVEDTSFFVKLTQEYAPNGNFNLYIASTELDTGNKTEAMIFEGVDTATVFDSLGFFDKVKVNGKTLRELGCTSFWNVAVGINSAIGTAPKNHLRLYCHADPEQWMAIADSITEVTVCEGALIPGYAYLNGDENATLYRADHDYVGVPSSANYEWQTHAQTEIESFEYVQGHDGTCGYLGVSLVGDDYLGNGEQKVANENYQYKYENFVSRVLINGQTGKLKYHGYYNLGEKGKGYYSFQVYATEAEVEAITVPAGTLFPTRAMEDLLALNNTNPLVLYQTKTEKTFYKNAEGRFVSFADYVEEKTAELDALYNEKVSAGCFEADVTAMETAVSTAKTAIGNATTIAEIDAAFTAAKTALDGVKTKAAIVDAAKADLSDYKAEEGYFRAAEKAQRDTAVESAQAAIESAASEAEVDAIVATVKTQIDGLKTAAQYADEELAVEKASAKAEIESYQAETAYFADEAAARAAAVEAGLAAVTAAKTSEEITAAVTDAKVVIDGIETKAAIVDGAKADLDGYKAEAGLYREAQATDRANIVNEAKTVIDNAADKAAVGDAVAAAKAAIDELKTDAQLTEEEKNAANAALAEKKAEAVEKVNEIKAGVDYSRYTAENQAKINELYKTAKDLIEDALTEEEINVAVAAFETEIGKLPKVEADNNSDVTDDGTDDGVNGVLAKLGCGSVIGVSSVTALTCALGVAAIALKKRKEE